jgi:hypothetical protein
VRIWWKLARRLALVPQLRRPGNVALFAHIALFALASPLLARLPLPRLTSLLEPHSRRTPPDHTSETRLIATVDGVLNAGAPVLRRGCLTRGLTRYFFLRRAGLDVALCFGIGTTAAGMSGHCWLVKEGIPFLEARDPRLWFTEVYRMPRASRRVSSHAH